MRSMSTDAPRPRPADTTADASRRRPGWVVAAPAAALVLVALCLRGPFAAVGPVLDELGDELSLSAAALAVDHLRVDHYAAVLDAREAQDLHLPGVGMAFDHDRMGGVGERAVAGDVEAGGRREGRLDGLGQQVRAQVSDVE